MITTEDANSSATVRALRGLVVATLIIPALLLGFATWRDRSTILQGAQGDALKLMAVFNEQAENLFKGHDFILDLIVNRLRDRDWDEIQASPEILHELEAMDNRLDEASAILLVDASGQTRATTLHLAPNEPLPPGDKGCFRALQSGASESCVSDPYLDPVSGQHLFSLNRRLERNGKFNGVAQVAISADYIVRLWAFAMPRGSDTISILRTDGVILARAPLPSGNEAEPPDIPKSMIGEFDKAGSGIIATNLEREGGDRITLFKKIAHYPAYITFGLDRLAILAAWYRDVVLYGLVAIGATAGIVTALGFALRRARQERRAVARWQAEAQQRENAQEQLYQSQKMESLGKLTGGIAHDFNNLLTVIVGNVSMAVRYVVDADGKRQLHSALKAGESAVVLTQRLLAFARKQVLQPQSVDMRRLVEGMQGLLLRTLGENVRLIVEADSALWPTLVDPNQMELVILNLAINARDAMPDGGTLSISVSNRESGRGAPPELAPGQYVVLKVSDTGTGMDAATLARATEPFFTTKDPGKGTGLGLAMMQGVVAQSGGATRLRSTLGAGTDVEVWLQRTQLPSAVSTGHGQTYIPAQTGETILVCDDDLSVLEFLGDALKGAGYRVVSVHDGRSVLPALEANPSIRLLVVDFAMPEMNGAAVVRQVRAYQPDLPVLLITGKTEPDAVQTEIPTVPILSKPFRQEQLAACVGELLRRTSVAA
jgi:signal transduction histidine kinase/CheY-like chemotaxis protein